MILENQAKQLVIESSANTTGASGTGTFTQGTGAQWARCCFTIGKKSIWFFIAAKEFVVGSTNELTIRSSILS